MRQRHDGKDPKGYKFITVLDLTILLYNVWLAGQDEHIGFEDPKQTLETFLTKLNRPLKLTIEDLESALWSCNLLAEKEKFWHPQRKTCDQFMKLMLSPQGWNKDYNFIVEDGEKNK
jgi:hypothetical protein